MTTTLPLNPIVHEERQIREAAYVARVSARERHREPIDEAESARLTDAHDAAQKTYSELGRKLYSYIAIRNRCELEELDDALRIRAQQLIDELQPQHKAAEAALIAARELDLGYRCGRTK
jgi:hypothetical protein